MAPLPLADDARVDVVVPAHDELAVLAATIDALHRHLTEHLDRPWQITIAENASSDGTAAEADRLAADRTGVRALHVGVPGRGRALRQAWTTSDAEVLVYMDADLSTDLAAVGPLVEVIASGRAELAIGSRLVPGSTVERRLGREALSRTYNGIVRSVLGARFRDAQCGFKAIRRDTAALLLPLVRDEGWFFDTELLVVAQRRGLRIEELPVRWTDDPRSSVRIVPTALADLRGVARLAAARRTSA
ncbi:MAG: glycosyl transferase family 2 [Ilumatobacteraceae bacterium]|nr:glycosyl transferase family 2 [Ilumatobacteraceae bacterium]